MADSGYYQKIEVSLTIKRIMVERKIEDPKEEVHSETTRNKLTAKEAIKLLADEVNL